MKRTIFMILLIWAIIILLITLAIVARAEKITLQWDIVPDIDGYYIYQTIRGGNPPMHEFDYENPIKTDLYPDGKIPQNVGELTIDLPGVENADTKYMFVARAFRDDLNSENSNEISYVVCLVPPIAPGLLKGGYDRDIGAVTLSWTQEPDAEAWRSIDHWVVFYRVTGAEEWIQAGIVKADREPMISSPIDFVAVGERVVVEMVVVAFRSSGVYSSNSDIMRVDIDRRIVPIPGNLRIKIYIPVI